MRNHLHYVIFNPNFMAHLSYLIFFLVSLFLLSSCETKPKKKAPMEYKMDSTSLMLKHYDTLQTENGTTLKFNRDSLIKTLRLKGISESKLEKMPLSDLAKVYLDPNYQKKLVESLKLIDDLRNQNNQLPEVKPSSPFVTNPFDKPLPKRSFQTPMPMSDTSGFGNK